MKQYNIIYADPPWHYKTWSDHSKKGGTANKHYPTMPTEDICKLPIKDLAAKDCALFLWATFPNLPEAFDVIKARGFKYITVAFVWVKRNKKTNSWFWGMGHWTRANAEICLLATRGQPKRVSCNIHQIVFTPIEEHSKKPDDVRTKIVALLGDIPRVELFARQATTGWDIWGNELPNTFEFTL